MKYKCCILWNDGRYEQFDFNWEYVYIKNKFDKVKHYGNGYCSVYEFLRWFTGNDEIALYGKLSSACETFKHPEFTLTLFNNPNWEPL